MKKKWFEEISMFFIERKEMSMERINWFERQNLEPFLIHPGTSQTWKSLIVHGVHGPLVEVAKKEGSAAAALLENTVSKSKAWAMKV